MTDLNILFKTAGGRAKNKELGLGHVYRCITLSNQMKKHTIFFLIEDYGGAQDVLRDNGFNRLYAIKKNSSAKNEIKKTLEIIQKKKIDMVIIDRFKTKKCYVSTIKKFVKTVVISDLKEIDYDADMVVNGFIGFRNETLKNKYGVTCFLGPKYQILNQKYGQRCIKKNKKYDLLITTGGFDNKKITDIVCQEIIKFLDKFKVKIILGPATIKSQTVQKINSQFKDRLTVIHKTKNMRREISNCRFGICGGGITSYEFTSMGVPFAVICQYKHQLLTANQWQKNNVGLNLGMPDNQLRKKLRKLLQSVVDNNVHVKPKRTIVDGLGAKRVARIIL